MTVYCVQERSGTLPYLPVLQQLEGSTTRSPIGFRSEEDGRSSVVYLVDPTRS